MSHCISLATSPGELIADVIGLFLLRLAHQRHGIRTLTLGVLSRSPPQAVLEMSQRQNEQPAAADAKQPPTGPHGELQFHQETNKLEDQGTVHAGKCSLRWIRANDVFLGPVRSILHARGSAYGGRCMWALGAWLMCAFLFLSEVKTPVEQEADTPNNLPAEPPQNLPTHT